MGQGAWPAALLRAHQVAADQGEAGGPVRHPDATHRRAGPGQGADRPPGPDARREGGVAGDRLRRRRAPGGPGGASSRGGDDRLRALPERCRLGPEACRGRRASECPPARRRRPRGDDGPAGRLAGPGDDPVSRPLAQGAPQQAPLPAGRDGGGDRPPAEARRQGALRHRLAGLRRLGAGAAGAHAGPDAGRDGRRLVRRARRPRRHPL